MAWVLALLAGCSVSNVVPDGGAPGSAADLAGVRRPASRDGSLPVGDLAPPPTVGDLAPPPTVGDLAMPPGVGDLAMPPGVGDLAMLPEAPDLGPPPPSPNAIPAALFGQTIHDATTGTAWPAISFAGVRLWDTHTPWSLVNPSRGTFDWSLLDNYVALAQQKGVDILYTVTLTPQWASARPNEGCAYGNGNCAEPSDINDYVQFVTALVTRYKGRIQYYEGWNEASDSTFYTGTPAKMVELQRVLYQTVKAIDPSARVLSPPPTTLLYGGSTWFDQFLGAGGAGLFDIAACHLYTWPDSPEQWSLGSKGNLAAYKQVLAKYNLSGLPIWNTESGWDGRTDDTTMAAYIARMYILGWANGVRRYYFYAWDDNSMGVLSGNTIRLPGLAMGRVYDWLVGAEMPTCDVTGSAYSCHVTRAGGYDGWIFWDTSGSSTRPLPAGMVTARRLDGTTTSLAGANSVPIGISPTLVQNR